MTRDELIAELRKRVETRQMHYGAAYVEAVRDCLELAEQLDSPPAMAWQDEPACDGWHWVDPACGDLVAVYVFRWFGEWRYNVWEMHKPLNGRRVCPIPAPPGLPQKGGAS